MSILGSKTAPKAEVLWQHVDGKLTPVNSLTGKIIAWAPQPGSAETYLSCTVPEVLFTGPRGSGKTDSFLMDFAQHCETGFGQDWHGIIFRRTYPELDDIIGKSRKWFPRIFGDRVRYNAGQSTWVWKSGERLRFRHFLDRNDYDHYHGSCVPGGDVLTETGWKPIQDVTIGERVVTRNTLGQLVLKTVVSKTEEQFNGSLVEYKGRGKYMTFTPNHKLMDSAGKLLPYEELPRKAKIQIAGGEWQGKEIHSFKLPPELMDNGHTENVKFEISGDLFCQFMGWYLSEGYWRTQKKVHNFQEITDMLEGKWLQQFGDRYTVFVPDIIKNASPRQLRIFTEAYIKGDGTKQQNCSHIWTSSKKMSDDLAEIGTKLGYAVYGAVRDRSCEEGTENNKLSYSVSFSPQQILKLFTDNRQRNRTKLSDQTQVKRVPHNGKVYCIGVQDTHNFFIRQNGCTWLSGNSIPFIGWEELTTWPNLDGYLAMFSCNRATDPRIPLKIRATTNPYGQGFNAVRRRFRLPFAPGKMLGEYITDSKAPDGSFDAPRIAINSSLAENRMLLEADPGYVQRIRTAAANPAQADAWVNGSWDIVAGGMFDDVWEPRTHVLYGLQKLPIWQIPRDWRLTRSYDHGQSHPFSVGWWAESDGTPLSFGGNQYGVVRGDQFRIAEWYGCSPDDDNKGTRMTATAIAQGILEREADWGISGRVEPGPADSAIFNGAEADRTRTVANDMQAQGVHWLPADKGQKSRSQGWQRIRAYMLGAKLDESGFREHPGLFVLPRCSAFIRIVPAMSRDDKNMDDCPKNACDHIGDEVRYMLRHVRSEATSFSWK